MEILPQEFVIRIVVTVGLVVAVLLIGGFLRSFGRRALGPSHARARFWLSQSLHIATLLIAIGVVVVLWGHDARELSTFAGWLAAGLAVASQRMVTAFAGYLVILRGKIFTIGDRITIGGVRGDVVALGFMQTTVMEMGQAPGERTDDPSMWIKGRQYTGRLVRITNDKIFDEPIYNFTREFPFFWEEIVLPIRYADDYTKVEEILLDVTRRHTAEIRRDAAPGLAAVRDRYGLREPMVTEPKVFLRLTDNWIELSVRFLCRDHDVRLLKDAMSREILARMQAVKIGIASSTYAIVEVPPIVVKSS